MIAVLLVAGLALYVLEIIARKAPGLHWLLDKLLTAVIVLASLYTAHLVVHTLS